MVKHELITPAVELTKRASRVVTSPRVGFVDLFRLSELVLAPSIGSLYALIYDDTTEVTYDNATTTLYDVDDLWNVIFKNFIGSVSSKINNLATQVREWVFPDVDGTVQLTDEGGISVAIEYPGVTHTGNTIETIVHSILIPANTFQAGDIIRFSLAGTKNVTVGSSILRGGFNTIVSLTGRQQIFTQTQITTDVWRRLLREMFVIAFDSQIIYQVNNNAVTDVSTTSATLQTVSIDFSVDQYFIVSILNGTTSADASTLDWLRIEILR